MAGFWKLPLFLLAILTCRIVSGLVDSHPSIVLNSFFSATASSVCSGDTPPDRFESPQNSGQFRMCGDQYATENILDNNSTTQWLSETGLSSANITLSLSLSGVSLQFRGIRLRFISIPPSLLHVQVHTSDVTMSQVFAAASADCAGTDNCQEYSIEETSPDGTTLIMCPVSSLPGSSTLEEITIVFDGFNETILNTTSQYYGVSDAEFLGWPADEHYVRSLTDISVEGEEGFPLLITPGDQNQHIPTSTNESLIAGFSSRGFAVISVDSLTQESYEWELPLLPLTTSYQIWVRYTNPGLELSVPAMVINGEQLYNARIVFSHCPTPHPCHAPLVTSFNNTIVAEIQLVSVETASIVIRFNDIDLYLDSIFAVPSQFYEATAIEDRARFLENCHYISGSLGEGTVDERFCLESAVQLSLEFYQLTPMCGCSMVGSAGNQCAAYGGQCDCIDQSDGFSRITGRRCDLCPYTTFLTSVGCANCDCSDPTEDCDVSTGQCDCPALVTGRTCDSCMTNSYGDPSEGCSPCGCGLVGTDYCNDTTGECVCKEGVGGDSCDVCQEGWYNLTSTGCQECNCDITGSNGTSCNDLGHCSCNENVGGEKCSSCLPGSFFFTSAGCTPCHCSGRSNNCFQNPNVTFELSEVCICPSPYEGESCDQCERGWYMSSETGDCELCLCNGLADDCLDGNGTCFDCRGNSTGVGCNVCIDGYYDADPSDPGVNCLPCPCSTVTALDMNCQADLDGNPVCNCRHGHEGDTCSSCSDGYFGSPPDYRCTLCDCNGNIDISIPGSCDITTGQCIRCIYNSTGDECEICATGFYGNATIQSCEPCDCHVIGSEGTLCDSETGQCSCLPGVNGLRCENCLPGYWNFTAGVGCEECACVGSVLSDVCDVVTGDCDCRDGVGGRDCEFCLHGYYNFSASLGCTPCDCGVGALNTSCNSLGQCYCQSGVTGAKCDLCQPFTFDLSSSGCESCGECEQMLRGDLEREEDILATITEQEELVIQLSDVDQEGLGEVMTIADQLNFDLQEISERLESTETEIISLTQSAVDIQDTISTIDNRVRSSLQVTSDLQPTAEEVGNHIQDIYNEVQRGLPDLVDVFLFAEMAVPQVAQWSSTANDIANDITNIALSHTSEGFSDDVMALEEEIERANQIAEQADSVLNLLESLNNEADNLIGQLGQITDDIDMMSSSYENVVEEFQEVQRSFEDSSTTISYLSHDIQEINDVINRAEDEIEFAENVTGYSNISGICEAVDHVTSWIGMETLSVSGSGSIEEGPLTPENDDGMESGSGMELGPDTLISQVTDLETRIEEVGVAIEVCEGVVRGGVNYSSHLLQQAEEICSILSDSLEQGGLAVEAILNYTSSIEAIEEAIAVATETRMVLEVVEEEGVGTEEEQEDLRREVEQVLVQSQSLLREARQELNQTEDLVREIELVKDVVEEAQRQSMMAEEAVNQLQITVNELAEQAGETVQEVAASSHNIQTSSQTVSTAHSIISRQLSGLHSNVSVAMATVNQTKTNNAISEALLTMTNTTLMTTREDLDTRRRQLAMGETERDGNEQELNGLASDLVALREDIHAARQAVAMIDVALRFHGNSSIGYRNDGVLTSDMASRISMVFNPSETRGGLMFHGPTGGESQSSLTLSLNNGSLTFATHHLGESEGVELVSTETGVIHEDQWYQLFATREGEMSQLSVSLLHGGMIYSTSTSSSSPHHTITPPLNDTLYLGGSPDVVAMGYSGCLDRVVINNSPLPLLLPHSTTDTIQLCGPRPPAEVARQLEPGAWLLGGESYVQVVNSQIEGASSVSIAMEFRTFSTDGLLLVLFSEDMAQRLAVEVQNGRLSLQFSRDLITMATGETMGVVNDGEWHTVEVEVHSNTAFLLVDSMERVNVSSVISITPFSPSSQQLYIGGVPSELQQAIGSSETSLSGCVSEVTISGDHMDLNSSLSHHRVSFNGCPTEVVQGARFTGEGGAVLRPTTEDVNYISFQFHTTQIVSLLLHVGNENSSVVISLYHTSIRVDVSGTVLYSIPDGLNDDAWHHVVLELGNGIMNLTVDDSTSSTTFTGPRPLTGSDVMVGGVTPPTSVPTTERFRGCIRRLFLNQQMVDFSKSLSLHGVALYGCRPAAVPVTTPLPPPPPPPLPPPPSSNPNISVGLDGQDGSFLAFSISPGELATSNLITLNFQTSSPNAMLLYGQGNIDFLAIELIRGHLISTYNLGSGRIIITSNHTYHNGLEHSVSLLRVGREGTMMIDEGMEIVSGVSPGNFTSLNIDMGVVFVGGTPTDLPPTNLIRFRTQGEEIPPSIRGCLLSLAINSVFLNLSSPEASQGTEPCLNSYTNIATFHGDGYLELLDEVRGGVMISASLEFRTTSCTGLLLYTASPIHPDHMALEIVDGLVRFIFDNGRGVTVIEQLPPSPICDGDWHSVTVAKEMFRGTLSVDEGEPVEGNSDNVNFVSLEINNSVFVGGVPDHRLLRSSVISGQVDSSSFQGCLRNLYMSTSSTGPLERDLTQASSSDSVTFNTCNP